LGVLFEEFDANATPGGVAGAFVFTCKAFALSLGGRNPLLSMDPKCAILALAPIGAVGVFVGISGELLLERGLRFLPIL